MFVSFTKGYLTRSIVAADKLLLQQMFISITSALWCVLCVVKSVTLVNGSFERLKG